MGGDVQQTAPHAVAAVGDIRKGQRVALVTESPQRKEQVFVAAVAGHDLGLSLIHILERRRRCVTMDNIGYGRYSGEIQLVRADLPADEKVHVIGEVPAEYDLLLDCIKRRKTFPMVKVS